MRTTLDIGEDVLRAVRALAERTGLSQGEVLTDLVRRALKSTTASHAPVRNGVPLLPEREDGVVDLELVNTLRDAE